MTTLASSVIACGYLPDVHRFEWELLRESPCGLARFGPSTWSVAMPMSYYIDVERGVVCTTATGVLTDADVLAHKEALRADPMFRAGMPELSDVRGVRDLRVTPTGVRRMVEADKERDGPGGGYKLAIVASEDVVYGMARMYELSQEAMGNVAVFREMEEAIAWLGLDTVE